MPSGRSASTVALTSAGSEPLQPDSPTPFAPSALAGVFVALLAPRPLSVVAAKMIGRYPPAPRGRYYSMITIMLITIMLLGITCWESTSASQSHNTFGYAVAWFFSFGFLTGSLLLPIALFAGYLALESSLKNWADWLDLKASQLSDATIGMLNNQFKPSVPPAPAMPPAPSTPPTLPK